MSEKPRVRHDPVTDFPGGVSRVVIVHGYNGYPAKHWYPWLAAELVAAGHAVTRVALPDPTRPRPGEWAAALATQPGSLDGAVVVAHSLGCFTTLRHLADHPDQRLAGVVFVAGFDEKSEALPQLDYFIGDGVDTGSVVDRLGKIAVVMSDGDHIVPGADTEAMAGRLGVEPVVLPGMGHFLYSDGVSEVPEVRDIVMGVLEETGAR
ncbi:alpha/beta hydrolase [uncultured Corynebacterium sp.]|uniref:RBBP9/YdeN family alpha/beta hydrolase n=1 Tax=uncultured Corynebacterium sp. TaxID=159447 RepID=UPI0025D2DEA1|nr:alpha/beta hydrolase [uncultured Corynebacterium sp.]